MGLLLLSPQIPMLFMGEEVGSETPFLFFTDFHDESPTRCARAGARSSPSSPPSPIPRRARPSPIPTPCRPSRRRGPSRVRTPRLGAPDHPSAAAAARAPGAAPGHRLSLGAAAIGPKAVQARWRLGAKTFTWRSISATRPVAFAPPEGPPLVVVGGEPVGGDLPPLRSRLAGGRHERQPISSPWPKRSGWRSIGSTSTAASGVSSSTRSAPSSTQLGSRYDARRRLGRLSRAPAPDFMIVEADTPFVLPTKRPSRSRDAGGRPSTGPRPRRRRLTLSLDRAGLSHARTGRPARDPGGLPAALPDAARPAGPRRLGPDDADLRPARSRRVRRLRRPRRLRRAAGAAGADALAISPTNALFPSAPERCSPYSPSSRDHLNPLRRSQRARRAAASPATGPDLIDWPARRPRSWRG
jgi:hypothetical protein